MKKILGRIPTASIVLVIIAACVCLVKCRKSKPTLHIYNWGDYLSSDVVADFEEGFPAAEGEVLGEVADDGPGVEDAAGAEGGVVEDAGVGAEAAAVAEAGLGRDVGEGADFAVGAELGAFFDDGGGMDHGVLSLWLVSGHPATKGRWREGKPEGEGPEFPSGGGQRCLVVAW